MQAYLVIARSLPLIMVSRRAPFGVLDAEATVYHGLFKDRIEEETPTGREASGS